MDAPAPHSAQAHTSTRRMSLDVPLYTVPLVLLSLGLGWQISDSATDPPLTSYVATATGLAAVAVGYRRLSSTANELNNYKDISIYRIITFLAITSIYAIYSGRSIIEGLNSFDANIAIIYTIIYFFSSFILNVNYFRFKSIISFYHFLCSIFSIFTSIFIFDIMIKYQILVFESFLYLVFLIPTIISIRLYEISILKTDISPIFITALLVSLFGFFSGLIQLFITDLHPLAIVSVFFLVLIVFSFVIRTQALRARARKAEKLFITKAYPILPAFLLCLVLVVASGVLERLEIATLSLVSLALAWSAFIIYAFLFVSPLPFVLVEAERRGTPGLGASYAHFRRLSWLGISDALAARGPLAIFTTAVGGFGLWLGSLPARLTPWLALPLVSAILLPPWTVWLGGASFAPLALPAAVWAAARWGTRTVMPLAIALVPHVVATDLPIPVPAPAGRIAYLALTGNAGFVAATLFWARFAADPELRRRLLTQESFGTGALLALAILAGCVILGGDQPSPGAKTLFVLNLLWIAASLVLVWGLSRAPVGGAVCLLLALVGLRFALYDLAAWPDQLAKPLQFDLGKGSVLNIEMPLFGLAPIRACGLILLLLIARFALRQGMSATARRHTSFSSPVSRVAGGALGLILVAASLDLGPGRGIGGSTIDVAAMPQEPFLLAMGFILGLWAPRPPRQVPRDLAEGWAPLGVLLGIGLLMFGQNGTLNLTPMLNDLSTPPALGSMAAFVVFIAFGYLVRLAAESHTRGASALAPQRPAAPATTAALYAGPNAVLDDLLGRDGAVPLARVIDATFSVGEARRLKEPGVTADMLLAAAPKPFAEVFTPPAPAAPAAGLILGGVGKILLGLAAGLALLAMTTQIHEAGQPSEAPATASDSPQKVQPQQPPLQQPQQQQQQQRPVPASPPTGGKGAPRS